MTNNDWRLTVKLKSHRALLEFMTFRNVDTAYALAKLCGIKVGVCGHLVSGRRNTCSLATAKAIEEGLGCPPGFLFEASMSQVCEDSRRGKAA